MDVNAEINGWKIFVHPCFSSQLEVLVEEVEALKEKNPEGFHKKAATKLLAAVLKVIHSEICADPSQVKFRQGSTLGDANKHWFRAKFLMQYRLFSVTASRTKPLFLPGLMMKTPNALMGVNVMLIKYLRRCWRVVIHRVTGMNCCSNHRLLKGWRTWHRRVSPHP